MFGAGLDGNTGRISKVEEGVVYVPFSYSYIEHLTSLVSLGCSQVNWVRTPMPKSIIRPIVVK